MALIKEKLMPRINFFIGLCLLTIFACSAACARAHDISLSSIKIVYLTNKVQVNVTTHISSLLKQDGKRNASFSPAQLDMAVRIIVETVVEKVK